MDTDSSLLQTFVNYEWRNNITLTLGLSFQRLGPVIALPVQLLPF
jgi:hypothetical protein